MGLCHEFGSQIRSGCDHPMRAGASACSCAECGVVCRGLFDGCPDVWARGPRPVAISATRAAVAAPAPGPTAGATVTSLPTGRTEGPRGVRSPSAVAAIGPAAVRADAGNGAGEGERAGERGGARASATDGGGDAGPAAAGATAGDPRREVFRWFEEAFEGVRLELQALIASMTHQQAMLAELLDSRQAELRLALVAESLPDVVGDAVRAAMDDHNTSMAESYDKSHDRFRDDVEQVRAITEAKVDELQESFEKLESVIAVHDEEAEQRESVRLGTLKGSVTRQITPITDALSRLSAKLDDITTRLDTSAPALPARAPAAPTRPARAPTRAAAASTPARTPAAAPASAAPVARSRPSAWAPAVAVGPVVARRVTSNRAAVADTDTDTADDDTGDDEPVVAPPRAKRPAATATGTAARRRMAQATGVPVPEPEVVEPEPDFDPGPDFEPMADDEPEAPRPRRITTRRPPVARGVAAPAPGNGSRAAAGPAAVRRPPTARLTAPRASSPAEPAPPEPPTATPRRVLGRRPEPVAVRPEPMVTYDLEDDPDGLFGVDDGDDEGWAPPAWVSEAAAKRMTSGPGRTPRR